MYITNKKEYTPDKKPVLPATKIKCPDIQMDAQKTQTLEKELDSYKIKFNKLSGSVVSKRLKSAGEKLAVLRRSMVYTAACVIMALLVTGTAASLDLCFASEAIVGGKSIGLVDDRAVFEEFLIGVEDEMAQILGEEPRRDEATFVPRLAFRKNLTAQSTLKQNILSTYDQLQEAYAIYAGDTMLCAALSYQDAQQALEAVKDQYREEGREDATLDFTLPVTIQQEFVPVGSICSVDGVVYNINNTSSEQSVEYTVKDSDTLWDIAVSNGMTVDQLIALNPDSSETIHQGDKLFLKKAVPLLGVRVSYIDVSEESIPYQTENIQDSTMLKGRTAVVQSGSNGTKQVTAQVIKVNGEVVERNVRNEEVLVEPVTAQIKIGTKVVPSVGTGSFQRPLYGTITSRFGYRSRGDNHTGIDLAASYGSTITAADNGRVSFSGWKGSYGYLVIIDHNNGYQTYYSHCSKLLVSAGQVVQKGQSIARVGSTGNSTGPHLHFEVRLNGVPQNPYSYIY